MKRLVKKTKENTKMKLISNSKKGMEMVQVAILVAIAIGFGLVFKDKIGEFITKTFESLSNSGFIS
ncbi:hypothetical protein FRZ06_05990 [Anoxybacterium hadale]|uniref:Uncharacterized protein n=1 Tax=Anoxybacterium hadale TaxID=3408580 RepID=A0ACD1A9A5_9FIRM|nr:hypothetical protein FRZ06_05990 [Clostridiales bacterium]